MSSITFEDVDISGSYHEAVDEREDSFEVTDLLRNAMGIKDEAVACAVCEYNDAVAQADGAPICQNCLDECEPMEDEDE